jgi:hypothetical protein
LVAAFPTPPVNGGGVVAPVPLGVEIGLEAVVGAEVTTTSEEDSAVIGQYVV